MLVNEVSVMVVWLYSTLLSKDTLKTTKLFPYHLILLVLDPLRTSKLHWGQKINNSSSFQTDRNCTCRRRLNARTGLWEGGSAKKKKLKRVGKVKEIHLPNTGKKRPLDHTISLSWNSRSPFLSSASDHIFAPPGMELAIKWTQGIFPLQISFNKDRTVFELSNPWDKRGGGRGRSSRPLHKVEGPGLQKFFLRPFGPQFGFRAPPLVRHC